MTEKKNNVNTANADNDSLSTWGNERLVFGYVDEVNGAGAVEIPEFVPTHAELIQLVKYYANKVFEMNHWCFVTSSSGSTEIRFGPYANRRVARVAQLLGDDEVDEAINEVKAELSKEGESWDIFFNGTKEQKEAYAEEYRRELDELSSRDSKK